MLLVRLCDDKSNCHNFRLMELIKYNCTTSNLSLLFRKDFISGCIQIHDCFQRPEQFTPKPRLTFPIKYMIIKRWQPIISMCRNCWETRLLLVRVSDWRSDVQISFETGQVRLPHIARVFRKRPYKPSI